MNQIPEELCQQIKERFQQKTSLRSLEKEFGINRKVISAYLKSNGFHVGKSYSEETLAKAISLYNEGKSIRAITIELGLDKNTLAKQLELAGVRDIDPPKRKTQKYKSTEITKQVMKMYLDKQLSVQSIASSIGKSTNYVWNILRHEDVIDKERTNRKYFFKENAFECIDTQEKAYWLGFLYADGYVHSSFNKYQVELTLKHSDKKHLQKFLDFLELGAPIVEKEIELNGKKHKAWRTIAYSKKLATDLTRHGCFQAKSLLLTFPDFLKKKLIRHFMRGYFDGDGVLSLSHQHNHTMLNFGAVGTKEFLDVYESNLHKIGINKCVYQPTGNAYQTAHGGNRQAKTFFDYIYKDATVYLTRKHARFIAVLGGNSRENERGMKRGPVKLRSKKQGIRTEGVLNKD